MVLSCVLRESPGRSWPEDRNKNAGLVTEGSLSPCRNGKALWLRAGDQSFGVLINGRATRLLLCGNVIHALIGQVLYEVQLKQGNSSASLVAQKRGAPPRPRAVPLLSSRRVA